MATIGYAYGQNCSNPIGPCIDSMCPDRHSCVSWQCFSIDSPPYNSAAPIGTCLGIENECPTGYSCISGQCYFQHLSSSQCPNIFNDGFCNSVSSQYDIPIFGTLIKQFCPGTCGTCK